MFKPFLSDLVLPPLGPLLLALLGLFLVWRRRRGGIALTLLGLALLWVLSSHGTAVWLSRTVLTQYAPLAVSQLKSDKVQAIVVLGGGVLPQAPTVEKMTLCFGKRKSGRHAFHT